jgi:hypothetical protein
MPDRFTDRRIRDRRSAPGPTGLRRATSGGRRRPGRPAAVYWSRRGRAGPPPPAHHRGRAPTRPPPPTGPAGCRGDILGRARRRRYIHGRPRLPRNLARHGERPAQSLPFLTFFHRGVSSFRYVAYARSSRRNCARWFPAAPSVPGPFPPRARCPGYLACRLPAALAARPLVGGLACRAGRPPSRGRPTRRPDRRVAHPNGGVRRAHCCQWHPALEGPWTG